MKKCDLCPRMCGANRDFAPGYCGSGAKVKVARAALHYWEEPCISGTLGSGTVFFSGCPLKCCFCQNYKISAENFGKEISVSRLCTIFQNLERLGAHNINLVSPPTTFPKSCRPWKRPICKFPLSITAEAMSGWKPLPCCREKLIFTFLISNIMIPSALRAIAMQRIIFRWPRASSKPWCAK